MTLDAAAESAFDRWFNARHPSAQCPACTKKGPIWGRPMTHGPFVYVVCRECAHPLLFDAATIGIDPATGGLMSQGSTTGGR